MRKTMRKVTNILLIVFTVTAFMACSGANQLSTNPADIQGDWQLSSMNGTQVQMSESYTVSFNTDGTVAGKADCNYFTGEYSASEEGSVSMNAVSTTKVKCSSNSKSNSYLNAVSGAESFQVRGNNTLTLNTGSGELVFSKEMMEEG
jgi:heat shock protein HslJ